MVPVCMIMPVRGIIWCFPLQFFHALKTERWPINYVSCQKLVDWKGSRGKTKAAVNSADLKASYSCVSFPAVWVGLLNNTQTFLDMTIFSHQKITTTDCWNLSGFRFWWNYSWLLWAPRTRHIAGKSKDTHPATVQLSTQPKQVICANIVAVQKAMTNNQHFLA